MNRNSSTWSSLSGILYPRRCPFCDSLLKKDEPYLCRNCAAKIKYISGPVCMKCGRPVSDVHTEYCQNCAGREHLFLKGFAPFLYADRMQDSLMRFKYGGRAEYARFYAEAIHRYRSSFRREWDPQLIAAVPIHPGRYIRRGYNQAQEIADRLSEMWQVPTAENVLFREKNTAPQKGLTPEERRKNLQNAFCVADGFSFPQRVLIVDDIYTTGATIDALAARILQSGGSEVCFVTAAIAAGQG